MKDLIALIARLVALVGEFNAAIVTDLATKAFDLGYKEGREKEAQAVKETPRRLPDLVPVMQAVRDGQKITAIKELRKQTNCGLKEGKEFVEALTRMWENGTLPSYPYPGGWKNPDVPF